MSHTPGPWHAKTNHFIMATEKDPKVIAEIVDDPAFPDGTQTANARLIAAAPELLAALKKVLAEINACLGIGEHGIREAVGSTNLAVLAVRCQQADAAIAKAEGTE